MRIMNMNSPKICGVILAAGMSRRMGSFKPTLPIGDTTFVKRIISMMREAGISEIFVVAGANRKELTEHLKDEDVRMLFNAQYETTQMLESIKLAIREVQRYADAIILTPVDVALPDGAAYRTVLRHYGEADCIRPVFQEKGGHPVLIGRQVFSPILAYEGENGLKGALKEAGAQTIEVKINQPGILMDADTPEDYQAVLKELDSQKSYIAVAGGLNVDIGGTSHKALVAADSNLGDVFSTTGGVGRNIAHNLCLMGQHVCLLTAYGDDQYREMIEKEADEIGLNLRHALCVPGGRTAIYLYLNEPDGTMAVAVNDMKICRELTPKYFEKNLELINRAKLLIVDANLSTESIAYLTEHVNVPIFADMVSAAKAPRFLPFLSKLHTIKPNLMEAEMLSGMQITDEETLMEAVERIRETGIRQFFISQGEAGIVAVDDTTIRKVASCPAQPVNMTGAGDACLAALAVAHIQGKTLEESAEYANAAAAITIESRETVSEKMSLAEIRARLARKS